MPFGLLTALCMVVGISDGDTLTARCSDSTIKVRLAEIDAPEKKQPFGQRAKASLSELCFGQEAEIRTQARDRYGRSVARVTCAGTDANSEQIRRGMAWVYDRYVTDESLYVLQQDARAAGQGLWVDADPMPPWCWRHPKTQCSAKAQPQ